MAKDSFILYLDQQEVFEMLSDEQAGKLIKNIFQYERSGKMPQMDKFLNLAFVPIMQILDKNRNKYEERCRKNKENIKIRWNKNNTIEYECKNKNTNYTDNDNDSDNDNDNELITTVINNKKSDSCVDGFSKIIKFYENNIAPMTPYSLELLQDYAKEMDADVIIYAMQISVEANKRTIQYIKAILNNWSNAGIKTLLEAKEESSKHRNAESEETEEEKKLKKIKQLEAEYGN